jgi:hypothetical protein
VDTVTSDVTPELTKWILSGILTRTRTRGEVMLIKNGSFVDIWMRINGKDQWIGIPIDGVTKFLLSGNVSRVILPAESDGNAEG